MTYVITLTLGSQSVITGTGWTNPQAYSSSKRIVRDATLLRYSRVIDDIRGDGHAKSRTQAKGNGKMLTM